MKKEVKITLTTGKIIELTGEEYNELKAEFNENVFVPYSWPTIPYYPDIWNNPTVTYETT